ncbi:uncharacterized protein J3R85_016512 [Psidium guajava]|nr:uncharacterized protein J3R85_016512 [Psidium guajava]
MFCIHEHVISRPKQSSMSEGTSLVLLYLWFGCVGKIMFCIHEHVIG